VGAAQACPMPAKLQLCADSLVRQLEAVEVTLWTPNAIGDVLILLARSGLAAPDAHVRGTLRVGEGEVGWVALHRTPMPTNDVAGDARTTDLTWTIQQGVRSFAGYPLVV